MQQDYWNGWKVDKLVDICNVRSKEKGKYTAYFTPENDHKYQNEVIDILDWFTKENDSVKRLGNDKELFSSLILE